MLVQYIYNLAQNCPLFVDENLPTDKREHNSDETERILREILNWIKVGNIPLLRETLIRELDTDEKKKVYELTDGTRSQYEIELLSKVTRRMVSYYWQKWYGLGILVPSEWRKGRMQKIVSLEEVGLSVPLRTGKRAEETEIEFRPEDLKKILEDPRFFADPTQLKDFAFSILPPPQVETLRVTRQELIDLVIKIFEQGDRMKQRLFMQALERRALDRQSTEFRKFFEAWERQIGRQG
jgi:hypothetical protein